jgi:hypothetical protein
MYFIYDNLKNFLNTTLESLLTKGNNLLSRFKKGAMMAKTAKNLFRPAEPRLEKNEEVSSNSDQVSDERLELAPRRITIGNVQRNQPKTIEEEFEQFTALKKEIKQNKELDEELKKAAALPPKLDKKKKGTSQQAM